MAKVLKLSDSKARTILKDTIKRFQIYFPKYIQTTKDFEKELGYRYLLSKKLELLYKHKNIELDKLGVFEEIGLKSFVTF